MRFEGSHDGRSIPLTDDENALKADGATLATFAPN
jgi:hypothetical protein